MYAKLTVIGNLGKDAVLNHTKKNNTPVVNFDVAVNENNGAANGNKEPLWVSCSLFGKRAEALQQYLTKGKLVFLTGKFGVNSWEDESGSHQRLAVKVRELRFLSKKDAEPDYEVTEPDEE
jgi:single-strand DNA-binding protein